MNNVTSTTCVPELLAPAGDWAMMKAAVANGADAVYFGLEDFNARRRAENFSLERLGEVMEFLRDRNVRGYVAFNTLIFPAELPRAEQFAAGIARAGADAVIVQDIGLMRLIRQVAPTLPIHASTQATQTHPAGLAELASLGVRRVILARELTLEQAAACRKARLEVETFVHGALCVSYSGQCLASAYLWGRSANRGQCGQACRLPYKLTCGVFRGAGVPPARLAGILPASGDDGLSSSSGQPHGTHNAGGTPAPRETPAPRQFPISPLDLNAVESLPALAKAGVCAVKIEGRLKGPHYVAAVVQLYRAALDALAEGRPFEPTAQHRRRLAATFSRGFTAGFLAGESTALVAGDCSARRGVFVGTVADFDYDGVVVELSPGCELGPIKPGDGLAFGDGESPQGGSVYDVKPWRMPPEFLKRMRRPVGRVEFVRLGFGRGDLDLKKIRFGDSVWKTADPAVMKELETSWSRDVVARPATVDFTVTAAVGGPLTLHAKEQAGGFEARADWPGPCERAEKHPLTATSAATQLARLGDTPFTLGHVTLRDAGEARAEGVSPARLAGILPASGEDALSSSSGQVHGTHHAGETPASHVDSLPALAPRSVLNDLRRQVVESLQAQRHAAARHAVADEHALQTLRSTDARTRGGQSDLASSDGPANGTHHAGETPAPRSVSASGRLGVPASSFALHVLVRSADALDAVLAWPDAATVGEVYIDADDLDTAHALAERCRRADRPFAIATPRILKPGDEWALDRLLDLKPPTWLVRNLAALSWLRQKTSATLVGDAALNAANDLAATWLLRAGLTRVTPSYDLSSLGVEDLARQTAPSRLETVVHHHMPMLHMQHNLGAALFLEDRNGQRHPIRRDLLGQTTAFGSYVQTAMPYGPSLRTAGLEHFRVELLDEPAEQIHATLDLYAAVLSGQSTVADAWPKLKALGPVTRGTWTGEKKRTDRE